MGNKEKKKRKETKRDGRERKKMGYYSLLSLLHYFIKVACCIISILLSHCLPSPFPLKVLGKTVRTSLPELGVIWLFIGIVMILFGAVWGEGTNMWERRGKTNIVSHGLHARGVLLLNSSLPPFLVFCFANFLLRFLSLFYFSSSKRNVLCREGRIHYPFH